MRVKGKVVAVLGVSMREPEEEINSEDRQLLIALAGHAAAAIEGARLDEENRERIREVELLKDYNESIVDSSRVGILVVGPDRVIRAWNLTMEEMVHQPRARVLGRPVREVFPQGFVDLLEEVPAEGRRIERLELEGGTWEGRTFRVAMAELRGREGAERRGLVVTFDEISEQVRMEQQLLRQERLAAVGLLASGVAHEINTPLTGISSYAEMLLEEVPEESPIREILQRISKQSWRASHIANSLLNFSRGSASARRVELDEMIEETLALFGPQIRGRRIDVVHERGPGPAPAVRGDQGRLQQVLLNLLLNARDAMPEGGSIRIATARGPAGVTLTVEDTGCGIPAEQIDRIWDPFFTTKAEARGTGLGLSISYGIVRDHGGTIEVSSMPGEGSVFRVRLPAWSEERVTA
jgi:PAS domain S-box-containing protein